jgi:hypothetical protein
MGTRTGEGVIPFRAGHHVLNLSQFLKSDMTKANAKLTFQRIRIYRQIHLAFLVVTNSAFCVIQLSPSFENLIESDVSVSECTTNTHIIE